jgi:pSer/pThr/pTyr-binding forkhead associated (FHA) protein
MSAPISQHAWLESAAGASVQIHGICNLGRSSSNQVLLHDPKASRRHAFIQPQSGGEFWLVDFGSTNGTAVNGRRVVQPILLQNGDKISIGGESLTFRKNSLPGEGSQSADTGMATQAEFKRAHCWLLLVDVEGSIKMSQGVALDDWPLLLGRWFSDCKETIESCKGQINKVLGDGLFAYWSEDAAAGDNIRRAVDRLCQAQARSQPRFRWVLHYGLVCFGGLMSLGEESLQGADVNFAFRMERVAAQSGTGRLLSVEAQRRLGLAASKQVGPFELSGFNGSHLFHTF